MKAVKQLSVEEAKKEIEIFRQYLIRIDIEDYPRASDVELYKGMILVYRGTVYRLIRLNKLSITLRPLFKHYKNYRRNQDMSYKRNPDIRVIYPDLILWYAVPQDLIVRMQWVIKRIYHLHKISA